MKRTAPNCPKLNQGGTRTIPPYFLRNEENHSESLGWHMIHSEPLSSNKERPKKAPQAFSGPFTFFKHTPFCQKTSDFNNLRLDITQNMMRWLSPTLFLLFFLTKCQKNWNIREGHAKIFDFSMIA